MSADADRNVIYVESDSAAVTLPVASISCSTKPSELVRLYRYEFRRTAELRRSGLIYPEAASGSDVEQEN